MNYLKLGIGSIFLLFLTSCSSDDDLEGQWVLASISLSSCPDDIPEITLQANDGCVLLFDESLCIDIVFESEEQVLVTYNYDNVETETVSGTYTDNGNSIMFCLEGDCQILRRDNENLTLNVAEDGCEAAYVFIKG